MAAGVAWSSSISAPLLWIEAYLADIFRRIHDHKINRIDELLPWNWTPNIKVTQAVA